MITPWTHYLIFLLETLTLLVAILLGIAGLLAMISKNKTMPGTLTIKNLNEQLGNTKRLLQKNMFTKKQLQACKRELKKTKTIEPKNRLFVLHFHGDVFATQVTQLREVITAVLQIATKEDRIMINLESPGGVVQGYGLAAAQLARIKAHNIPLTVCIDKAAASGGYLMACVADEIIAAPFAVIGSIGVVAQIPNFYRLLKKHDIDVEQITAGKYKRTLTLFGENTAEGREKLKTDLAEIHDAFKNYITQYRSTLNLEEVANGDYWLAVDAKKYNLVDRIMTSDDYIVDACKHFAVFDVSIAQKKSLLKKLNGATQAALSRFLTIKEFLS